MKFCKDCRYLQWAPIVYRLRYCTNPVVALPPNPLTGVRDWRFASHAREFGHCKDGYHFEPKRSVWAWLKGWFTTPTA